MVALHKEIVDKTICANQKIDFGRINVFSTFILREFRPFIVYQLEGLVGEDVIQSYPILSPKRFELYRDLLNVEYIIH